MSQSSVDSLRFARARSQAALLRSSAPVCLLPETRRAASRPWGLRNLGNSCYQNSVLQALLALESFSELVKSGQRGSLLSLRLEELLREREETGTGMQDLRRVREVLKSRQWRGREQQDSVEFYLSLIDQLNESLNGSSSDKFRGSLVTRTRCEKCGTDSTKKDPFFVIPLSIDTAQSLEEALRSFQADERLSGADSYDCERCRRKTEATKSVEFSELPDVLVFVFKRFRWTREGKCEKTGKCVKFPTNSLVVPCSGSLLGRKYELVATVQHKGDSTDSGHYTANVKGKDSDKWFLCDDSHVAEIANSAATLNENAYMVFYQTAAPLARSIGQEPKSMLLAQSHRQF